MDPCGSDGLDHASEAAADAIAAAVSQIVEGLGDRGDAQRSLVTLDRVGKRKIQLVLPWSLGCRLLYFYLLNHPHSSVAQR